ncbi:hypothetical protein [Ekhidna sp.]|uniref:hypothetical protein n=1 Tax=Ekhidna sp. TaxID=2608089 RepID=UPI003B501BD8
MKLFLFSFICSLSLTITGQSVNFGDSTTLFLEDGTVFFFGGNTVLGGSLSNSGTLVSYSDMDLGANQDIGNIKFIGDNDQILDGGTIETGDFVVDKQGSLILMTAQITVTGELQTTNGVIETQKEDDILVTGTTMGSGLGYVEGKLFGISKGTPITFPMGVNGSPNYMTISNLPENTRVNVECIIPDQNTLYPDDEMIGISDEVEWIVKVSGASVEAQIQVNFSGVDLNNFTNGTNIRSRVENPGLVLFSKADTLFHIVDGTLVNNSTDRSQGEITSNDNILITGEGSRLAIALIPSIDRPRIFVPNAFSPGSMMEENQLFRVFYAGAIVTSIDIQLYDSFNKLVFSTSESGDNLDLSNYGWNGVLNSGLDAPEGVYYYKVQLISDEEVINQTGSVLLVK